MILFVHTHYQLKGGEDLVFTQESNLISKAEPVSKITFKNQNGFKGAFQFLLSIWNIFAAKKLKKAINKYKPDIIHFHNLHYAIGPLAIRVAHKAKVKIVITFHNYRLLCPSATLLYKGEIFTDSINVAFPWKAIRNGVYRGSILQTFWLSFTIWFHKKIRTWDMVDRYIVLTDFAKQQFVNSSFGIPEKKFVVKPNFIDHFEAKPTNRKEQFLFVGRLSEEKGLLVLLKAFEQVHYQLKIVGDGPLRAIVEETANRKQNISYIGPLDSVATHYAMCDCDALIFPSIWYEGMPMTLLESFANGTSVIASNIGAIRSIVINKYNGLCFEANNVTSLIKALNEWSAFTIEEKSEYRERAFNTYLNNYTPEINKKLLSLIYNSL